MEEVFLTAGTLLGCSERKPVDQVAFARVYAGWDWFHRKVREEGKAPCPLYPFIRPKPTGGCCSSRGQRRGCSRSPRQPPPNAGPAESRPRCHNRPRCGTGLGEP